MPYNYAMRSMDGIDKSTGLEWRFYRDYVCKIYPEAWYKKQYSTYYITLYLHASPVKPLLGHTGRFYLRTAWKSAYLKMKKLENEFS